MLWIDFTARSFSQFVAMPILDGISGGVAAQPANKPARKINVTNVILLCSESIFNRENLRAHFHQ